MEKAKYIKEKHLGSPSIEEAINEYKQGPLTPELVNKTWGTIWRAWGERSEQTFQVPACDRSAEELAQLQKENRAVLLIPDNVSLIMLGKIFPKTQNCDWIFREWESVMEDKQSGEGCVDIEMDINCPNRYTDESEIEEILGSQKRRGQRLTTYIIGSNFSKLLTGHYFDDSDNPTDGSTVSRLPGSKMEGWMLRASYHRAGWSSGSDHTLWVSNTLEPFCKFESMGFRTEGVKKLNS